MAREYSAWNATIAALQFWTADLEAHVLSSATEQVYIAFFYSASTYMLCQESDEVLFGHFMTTLNAAFESKITLEDEGYDSGSKNFNIPTPLRRTSKINHFSSEEHASFGPDPVMPCSTGIRESHCRPVCRCLTFSSSDEDDHDTPMDETQSPNNTLPVQYHADTFQHSPSKCMLHMYVTLEAEEEDVEEDFQTVPLDGEHWDMEEILDRPLYIHKHPLSHGLCQYLCPYVNYQTSSYYDTLDLSDISEFEEIMTTSSNEDIPPLEGIGYRKRLWLEMNVSFNINSKNIYSSNIHSNNILFLKWIRHYMMFPYSLHMGLSSQKYYTCVPHVTV